MAVAKEADTKAVINDASGFFLKSSGRDFLTLKEITKNKLSALHVYIPLKQDIKVGLSA